MRVQLDPANAGPAMRAMPPQPKRALRAALEKLGNDPSGKSVGLDVKRLDAPGLIPVYRLRSGDWRAAFIVGKNHLRVVRVFHRSEGYDWVGTLRLAEAVDEDIAWAKRRAKSA